MIIKLMYCIIIVMLMLITLTFALPALAQEQGSPSAKSQGDYQTHYNNALQFEAKHDNASAIKEFQAAIQLNPDFIDAHIDLGMLYVNNKRDYVKALVEFNEVLRLDPDSVIANDYIGWIAYNKSDFELAFDKCNYAVKLDPYYHDAHYHLALMYWFKEDYANAFKEFKLALDIVPWDRDSRYILAFAYAYSKDFESASKEFERVYFEDYPKLYSGMFYDSKLPNKFPDKVINLIDEMILALPNDPIPHVIRASLYDDNKVDKIRSEYKKAISVKPDYWVPHFLLARTYGSEIYEANRTSNESNKIKLNKLYDIQEKIYKDLLHVLPGNLRGYRELGHLYSANYNYTKAIAAYKEYLRQAPHDDNIWWYLGMSYEDNKQINKAVKIYKELLLRDPNNNFARSRLAGVYQNRKDYSKAIDEYKQVLNIEPEDTMVLYQLSECYKYTNQIDKAIEIYKELDQKMNTYMYYGSYLINKHIEQKEFDKAKQLIKEILEKYPDEYGIHSQVSYYYADMSDFKNAANEMLLEIKEDPDSQILDMNQFILVGYYFQDKDFDKALEVLNSISTDASYEKVRLKNIKIIQAAKAKAEKEKAGKSNKGRSKK